MAQLEITVNDIHAWYIPDDGSSQALLEQDAPADGVYEYRIYGVGESGIVGEPSPVLQIEFKNSDIYRAPNGTISNLIAKTMIAGKVRLFWNYDKGGITPSHFSIYYQKDNVSSEPVYTSDNPSINEWIYWGQVAYANNRLNKNFADITGLQDGEYDLVVVQTLAGIEGEPSINVVGIVDGTGPQITTGDLTITEL